MSREPHHNIRAASATQVTAEEWWKAVKSPEYQAVNAAVSKAMQELMRPLQAVNAAVSKAWQEVMRPLQKDSPEYRKVLQDLNAAIAAADAKTEAELAKRYLPAPKDIDGWEKLARIVEIRKESIGELTAREIYNRALEWAEEIQIEAERRKIKALLEARAEAEIAATSTPTRRRTTTKTKRNTELDGAKLKFIAAMTKHHRDADGKIVNQEPLSCEQLAKLAGVKSKGTASKFFKKFFGSHRNYKKACEDYQQLATDLKLLNGEFTPAVLMSRIPPEQVADDNDADE